MPPTLAKQATDLPSGPPVDADEWDLDIRFVEAGEDIDTLIYMTGDGCGRTCQSACPASCK